MGFEMLEIGVHIKKFVVFSIRTCYRSVFNHPFLVGMLFFLVFLHRSFPFIFSLLVSASPILVCTFVLLGTLLRFGQQPNVAEIEKEERLRPEIMSLKTEVSRDATIVERDESFNVERYTGKRSRMVQNSGEERNSTEDMVNEVDKADGDLVYSTPLMEETSREIQLGKRVIEGVERELYDSGFESKSEMNEEEIGDGVVLEKVEDDSVELQQDKSHLESIDSHEAYPPGSTLVSPWKKVEEVDNEGSDFGSDQAESSSPDASMADYIPMLDELHPLLGEDVPQPSHTSHDGSDAASERSPKFSNGSNESDEDSENQEEEVGDEDNDDDDEDEEEEETRSGKEDGTKCAITWTEDDQKNVINLGTSELERNQRLENLIARRRVWRMMTEKNLIDLESADPPHNIAPISTRRNPFDLTCDSEDNTGFQPIPGSAPSVLLPRPNPFDLPYEFRSEEKLNPVGDSFQQEFTPFPSKEMFFRRHESFNVGPSFFGLSKLDKQDIKLRPYFVPEHVASEGTSYSSILRQSSELSDSKVSSVPETESICSVGDQDEKKFIEEDFSQEAELILDLEHPSEHVGHGSESSEDVDDVELGQAEKREIEHDEIEIKLGNVESHPEVVSIFSETGDLATLVGHNTGEIHLNTGADEVNYSSQSSLSSFSEERAEIVDEKEDEMLLSLEPKKENRIESGLTIGLIDDSQHKEPVYDSSPSADRESEVSNQSIEIDTPGNKQMLPGSSDVHPDDESESRITGVTDGVEHNLLSHGFSRDDHKLDSANVPVVVEQVSGIALSLETVPIREHSLDKEVVVQINQDQVLLSSFDAHLRVGIDQEAHEELLPTHSQGVSAERSMYKLEEQLPLSEKYMDELSSGNGELLEPSIIPVESIEEASVTGNLDASEVQPQNKVSSNVLLTPDPSSSSEISETRSPTGLADSKENVLDEIQNTDHIPGQHSKAGLDVHEQDISEEAEEIDKELLLELDTVGDFRVNGLGVNLNEVEKNWIPGGEINSEMPLVEAPPVEDVDSTLNGSVPQTMKSEVEIGKFEIPHKCKSQESWMSALEAQSLENVGPEETKAEYSEYGIYHKDSSLTETQIELPVLEARSIKDIDLAFKQLHNVERRNSPSFVDGRPSVAESKDPAETNPDLHIERHGSHSSDDDGPDVIESKHPAETDSDLQVGRHSEHTSVDDSVNIIESEDPSVNNSDLHISEARPLKDTGVALKLVQEGNDDKLLTTDFINGSAECESNGVDSFEEIESSIKEPGVRETSTSSADQSDRGAHTSDGLSLSMSDGKGKKATSHELSSSSSSSSSSSDAE